MAESSQSGAIAIVGMAGRFPGASDLDAFWENIRNGVESLESFSDDELAAAGVDATLSANPRYVRRGTVLDRADEFDASFFGYSPREAQVLDPQQRIFLECAWEAVENAGHAGDIAGQAVGVYAGVGINAYLLTQLMANPAFAASVGAYQVMLGNDKDFLATRVSYKLDLRGPSVSVQTACSTSLVAVTMACRALQRGECDMALAGGVSVVFPQRSGYLFEEGMIFSPDGHCRPFDANAQGTRGGSGAGVVVLKRLADAIADRDTIHAVILGAAMNNDGAGKAGFTAPSIEGQVEVIATAQALAGVDARTITYVEAHGTATPLGDPIEIAALTQVFAESTSDVGFCRIGSLKANIGHLDAAAGVAGLIKTVLALEHHELPPLVNFRAPNPRLGLENGPFVASSALAPWNSAGDARLRAGVSSFGIGGTNAHVVLEEAPPVSSAAPQRESHLLLLSAKTPDALERATANLAAHLRAHPEASLTDVEFTLAAGRRVFAHRRAVVAHDVAQAIAALVTPREPVAHTSMYDGAVRPVAFLFSGQGSQHARMGSGLYRDERVYRDAFDRCAAGFLPHIGVDLRSLVLEPGDEETINETRYTQPALFALEYALATLWMSRGVTPVAMLGHSIGEYVAAHLAGVMALDDALAIVAARGALMQALPGGSMAAVNLTAMRLEALLPEFPGVEIAAVNAGDLCTVSGERDAVGRLTARLQAQAIDVRPLRTSHAFHSAMMEPALEPFRAVVETVRLSPPTIPYVSNLTGTWITSAQSTSPDYYAQHLRHAVRFEAGVRLLASDPRTLMLEAGPGTALTSLARMTVGKDGNKRVFASLPHPRDQRSDVDAELEAAGRLWLAGAELDWNAFYAEQAPRRVPLPTYPFERKRYWVDAQPAAAAATTQSSMGGRRIRSIDDWTYAPTWTRDDGRRDACRLVGTWIVLGDRGALSESVVRRASAAGAKPVLIVPGAAFERQRDGSAFVLRPSVAEDLVAVVDALRAEGATIGGAIHLWSLVSDDDAPAIDRLYHSIVALAAALDPVIRGRRMPIVVGTSNAQSVLDEAVHNVNLALVQGPVLTLPAELPELELRSVDVDERAGRDGGDAAARIFIEEAANEDGEKVVAHRAGRRWVRRFEPVTLPPTSSTAPAAPTSLAVKPHGVYLITGGLGGVGLSLAKWLARQERVRIVLVGRTALPPRAEWDALLENTEDLNRSVDAIRAIREIESAGSEVMTAAANAADSVAMARVIELARSGWGAIDGVIHAAGIAGNGRVAFLEQRDEVDTVLAPKMAGLHVLVELLGDAPLDFVALVSSMNSVLGAPGLSSYAAANAVLDAFTESASRPRAWKNVVSVNFGPWREVGMAARLYERDNVRREQAEAFNVLAMRPDDAAEAFGRVLASGRPQVVVLPQDLVRMAEHARTGPFGKASENGATDVGAADTGSLVGSGVTNATPPAVSANYEPPATDTERRLAGIWSDLLGVERVGAHDDFFELGGHSLLATRVLARIDQSLGARLSLRDVFEAPTVRKLAEKIAATIPNESTTTMLESDREELEF